MRLATYTTVENGRTTTIDLDGIECVQEVGTNKMANGKATRIYTSSACIHEVRESFDDVCNDWVNYDTQCEQELRKELSIRDNELLHVKKQLHDEYNKAQTLKAEVTGLTEKLRLKEADVVKFRHSVAEQFRVQQELRRELAQNRAEIESLTRERDQLEETVAGYNATTDTKHESPAKPDLLHELEQRNQHIARLDSQLTSARERSDSFSKRLAIAEQTIERMAGEKTSMQNALNLYAKQVRNQEETRYVDEVKAAEQAEGSLVPGDERYEAEKQQLQTESTSELAGRLMFLRNYVKHLKCLAGSRGERNQVLVEKLREAQEELSSLTHKIDERLDDCHSGIDNLTSNLESWVGEVEDLLAEIEEDEE